ncbi:MAG TPA: thioredoxin domain-containing protein, partial [Burkholderiales bacterium]|nr:thioredoxin domain-containing protein [Burkholderiales bacterium]
DQIYQTAHAMLARRGGGWPLTMFLSPDQKPFFGGTYFPKEARHGLPGFKDLLGRVAAYYRENRQEIDQQNDAVMDAFGRTLPRRQAGGGAPDPDLVEQAVTELESGFDRLHGGFGDAPKFPHPAELEFCLRRHAVTGDANALSVAALTLRRMAEGGIYDQLGGGFCRYSVDRTWTIPHFEKMLYDNGPLLRLNVDAWLVTGDPLFRRVAEETAAWVMRDMQSPEGGYYSTLDADSEHEEGKFYVWTPEQVRTLLAPGEYAILAPHFGLDAAPNFEGTHWHLTVAKPLEAVATALGIAPGEARRLLDAGRAKLFAARAQRVRPGRDEKVLTAWNGLMIKGMARAAAVLGQGEWLASARRALDFLRGSLYRDGRLRAVYKDGQARFNAYLDDYAFLMDALLEVLATDFRIEDLDFARELAETLLAQFEDPTEGGFFFTSQDHEPLIHRPKTAPDNATPSGNGVAVFALQRLGHLAGEPRYLAAAERALTLFAPQMARLPSGHASLMAALTEQLAPPSIVVPRGPPGDLGPWQQRLAHQYRPDVLVAAVPEGAVGLPPALDKPAQPGVTAWVCRGTTCLPVINSPETLEEALKNREMA